MAPHLAPHRGLSMTPEAIAHTFERYPGRLVIEGRRRGRAWYVPYALSRAPGRTLSTLAYERITIDPGRMRGLPCIRDTRMTVSAVLGQLAAGRSADEVLVDYPYLERADILAALEFAADTVQDHELPLARPA